jgi:hypothetical protein
MPLIFLLIGRLWCSICPFDLISGFFGRTPLFSLKIYNWIYHRGTFISITLFCVMAYAGAVAAIEASGMYTFFFISGLISLCILTSLFIGKGAYCVTICPVGVLAGLYSRFSITKLKDPDPGCGNCNRRFSVLRPPDGMADDEFGRVDWKNRIECVKKCNSDKKNLRVKNPLSLEIQNDGTGLFEATAPSLLILILSAPVLYNSHFFSSLFTSSFMFMKRFEFFFLFFIIASIFVLIAFYTSLLCLTPLLMAFHLSLFFRGIQPIQAVSSMYHYFPFAGFLQAFGNGRLASYGAIVSGLGMSFAAFIFFLRKNYSRQVERPVPFIMFICAYISFFFTICMLIVKYSFLAE